MGRGYRVPLRCSSTWRFMGSYKWGYRVFLRVLWGSIGFRVWRVVISGVIGFS